MKTETEKYQGWTNHATWCVGLHLDNAKPYVDRVQAIVYEALTAAPVCDQVKGGVWTVKQARRAILADALKDFAESILLPDGGTNTDAERFRTDMMRGYFEDVNWGELAEHYISVWENA